MMMRGEEWLYRSWHRWLVAIWSWVQIEEAS